jgi:hypothetical protein
VDAGAPLGRGRDVCRGAEGAPEGASDRCIKLRPTDRAGMVPPPRSARSCPGGRQGKGRPRQMLQAALLPRRAERVDLTLPVLKTHTS